MAPLVLLLVMLLVLTAPAAAQLGQVFGPRVLFEDDFKERQWPTGAFTLCRTSYDDRGFAVESVSSSEPCVFRLGRAFAADVRIEVAARLRRGSRERAYGLAFGMPLDVGRSVFSTFTLTANGTYRLAQWRGRWSYPIPPTVAAAIRTEYGAANRLAVEVRGRNVTCYINGKRLETARTTDEAAGAIGFYVDGRGMDVVFTELRVIELAGAR